MTELRQHESQSYLQAMRDVEKRKLVQGTASSVGIATNVSRDSTKANTTTNVVNKNNQPSSGVDSKPYLSRQQENKDQSAKISSDANSTTHDNITSNK